MIERVSTLALRPPRIWNLVELAQQIIECPVLNDWKVAAQRAAQNVDDAVCQQTYVFQRAHSRPPHLPTSPGLRGAKNSTCDMTFATHKDLARSNSLDRFLSDAWNDGVSRLFAAAPHVQESAGTLNETLKSHGVDDEDVAYYDERIRGGSVFASVDSNGSSVDADAAREILFRNGGHSSSRARSAAQI